MRSVTMAALIMVVAPWAAYAQTTGGAANDRNLLIRDRYETVLLRNPHQPRAFEQVFDAYFVNEGVSAWEEKLRAAAPMTAAHHVLLARIFERRLDYEAAAEAGEAALAVEADPLTELFLGEVYYRDGDDEAAGRHLRTALETLEPPMERTRAIRLLGNVSLRAGDREAAIGVWRQLAEEQPQDIFARIELAEIYEDNSMWAEAIESHERVAELASGDPYRQCMALRAVASCQVRAKSYPEAIATYKDALDRVSPGNWLFDDLKTRLVETCREVGELESLAAYFEELVAAQPAAVDYAMILAEVEATRGDAEAAEGRYEDILERDPSRTGVYERLLALYRAADDFEKELATFARMAERFPREPEYLRRWGEALLQEERKDEALEVWRHVLGDMPDGPGWAQLASWYEVAGLDAEAIEAYGEAVALRPDLEWTLRLAGLRHAAGEEEAALETWMAVIENENVDAGVLLEVAGALESHDYWEEAEAFLRRAAEDAPEDLDVVLRLARHLLKQERPDDAKPHFERLAGQTENEFLRGMGEDGVIDCLIASNTLDATRAAWEESLEAAPEDTEQMLRLARLYERSGAPRLALEMYKRGAEAAPEDTTIRRTLADSYRKARQIPEAIEVYTALVEDDPGRGRIYYRELMELHLAQGSEEEAIAAAGKLVEAAPSDADARLDLARVCETFGRYDEAVEACRAAVRIAPEDSNYHQAYGELLDRAGRIAEARVAYRKMLETARFDETRVEAAGLLAAAHMRTGDAETLVEEFRANVRATPNDFNAYKELAIVLERMGDGNGAYAALDSALGAVEDKEEPLREMLRAAYDRNDLERVITCYQQLMDVAGSVSPFELERLGGACARLGRTDEAMAAWRRIVELQPEDPQSHADLARILFEHGFEEESVEAWESALTIAPDAYRIRYEYAVQLYLTAAPGEALDQLTRVLDTGDVARPTEEEAAAAANPSAPAQPPGMRFNISRQAAQILSQGAPQRWYGSYESFRPALLTLAATFARDSDRVEDLVAPLEARMASHPDDFRAAEDLYALHSTLGDTPASLAVLERMQVMRPEDIELTMQLANMYQREGALDEATELLEAVMAAGAEDDRRIVWTLGNILSQAGERAQAMEIFAAYSDRNPENQDVLVQMANLHYDMDQKDKAIALIERLLQTAEANPSALYAAATLYMRQEDVPKALEVMDSMRALFPDRADAYQSQIARNIRQQGHLDEAMTLYEDLLLSTRPVAAAPARAGSRIFSPERFANQASNVNGVLNLLATMEVSEVMDHVRIDAFTQLTTMGLDESFQARIVEKLEAQAEVAEDGDDASVRAAREATIFLLAQDLTLGENAEERLEQLLALGTSPLGEANLELMLLYAQEDYDALVTAYQRVGTQFPAQRDAAAAALKRVYTERGDSRAAIAMVLEELERNSGVDATLRAVRELRGLGAGEEARRILEGASTRGNVHQDVLSQLAQLYAESGDFARAWTSYEEAWQRAKHAPAMRSGRMPGGMYASNISYPYQQRMAYPPGMYGRSSGASASGQILSQWANFANSQGRQDELIARMEEEVAAEPGNWARYEDLASVYSGSARRDMIPVLCRDFLARQPGHTGAIERLIEHYRQTGDEVLAIPLYEQLAVGQRTRQGDTFNRMLSAYSKTGAYDRAKVLIQEEARRITQPQQLVQLAHNCQNMGFNEEALNLYEEIDRRMPGTASQYAVNRVNLLQIMGRDEEAVALCEELWNSQQIRSNPSSIVNIYQRIGRLEDLKADVAVKLEEKPKDTMLLQVAAEIAKVENRYDEAMGYFDRLDEEQPNRFIYARMALAESAGKYADAHQFMLEMGAQNGHYDYNHLSYLAIKMGDGELAYTYMTREYRRGGGNSFAWRNMLQQLISAGMIEKAAEHYLKSRPRAATNENMLRQFDQTVAEACVTNEELAQAVLSVLGDDDARHRDVLCTVLLESMDRHGVVSERLIDAVVATGFAREDQRGVLKRFFEQRQMPEKARAAMAARAEGFPDDTSIQREYAQALLQEGKETEAIDYLAAWVGDGANLNRAHVYLSILEQHKMLGRIEALRERVPELVPERRVDAEADVAEVRVPVEQVAPERVRPRTPEEEARALAEPYASNPGFDTFTFYMRKLIEKSDYDRAYAVYQENLGESWMPLWRGEPRNKYFELAFNVGDIEGAAELIAMRLRHDRRGSFSNELWRHTNSNKEEVASAVGMAENLIREETGGNAQTLGQLAELWQRLGNDARCLSCWQEALELQPGEAKYLQGVAYAYGRMGKTEEEIATFRQLVEVSPMGSNRVANTILLARALESSGAREEAMATAAGVLDTLENDDTRLRLAEFYRSVQAHEEALPLFEAVYGSAEARMRQRAAMGFAVSQLALGRIDEALEIRLDTRNDKNSFPEFDTALVQRGFDGVSSEVLVEVAAKSNWHGIFNDASEALAARDEYGALASLLRGKIENSRTHERPQFLMQTGERLLALYDTNPERMAEILAGEPVFAEAIAAKLLQSQSSSRAETKSEELLVMLKEVGGADVETLIGLGSSIGDARARRAWYEDIAREEGISLPERRDIAVRLLDIGGKETALPMLREVAASWPGVLLEHNVFAAIAREVSVAESGAWLDLLDAYCGSEAHRNYYRAKWIYASGDREEAIEVYLALAIAEGLTPEMRRETGSSLMQLGEREAAIAVFTKLSEDPSVDGRVAENARRALENLSGPGR